MLKITFIILYFIPLLEAPIEVYLEKKKPKWVDKHDKSFHFWTAFARYVLMAVISIILGLLASKNILPSLRIGVFLDYFLKSFQLQFCLHAVLFNILYNKLSGREIFYFRKKGIDVITGGFFNLVGIPAYPYFLACLLLFSFVIYFQ